MRGLLPTLFLVAATLGQLLTPQTYAPWMAALTAAFAGFCFALWLALWIGRRSR